MREKRTDPEHQSANQRVSSEAVEARCCWDNCRITEIAVTYLGKPLCEKHWDKVAEMAVEEVKKRLGYKKDANNS